MGFGFLKRKKKEVVDLEDAEQMLLEKVDTLKAEFEYFLSEKYPELRSLIRSLLNEMEALNSDGIHPRLRNQARNFTSAMVNLWRDLPEMDRESIFDETAKRLEKVAVMRLKQFRFLFGVYPPEIEQIDGILKQIAGIIHEAESKKRELGLESLSETLRMIERVKKLAEDRKILEKKHAEIAAEMSRVKLSNDGGESQMENGELFDLLRRKDELETQIGRIEAEIHRKVAYARKPLKMYAHMTGRKVNLDTHHFLSSLDEISMLASGAISEIKKGNIKLKEKNLDAVLSSLSDIASGKLKNELENLKELKDELFIVKNKMKSCRKPDDSRNEKTLRDLEKKLESVVELMKKTDRELDEIRRVAEARLSELVGKDVVLRL